MSVVQTRPRVTGVAIARCSAASGFAHTQRLIAGLDAASLQAFAGATPLAEVQPFTAIQAGLAAHAEVYAVGQSVAATKAHAAALLAACRLDRPEALEAPVRALAEAATPAAAQAAHRALVETVSAQHHRAFVATLAGACARAAAAVGFAAVETAVAADGTVRVVASDAAGRTLVSEIAAASGDEPELATEVVGVHDGSCHTLLDRFDEALEAEGVRSAAPTRRETGGAALLETARLVVRQALRPKPRAATTSTAPDKERRRRRTQTRTSLR